MKCNWILYKYYFIGVLKMDSNFINIELLFLYDSNDICIDGRRMDGFYLCNCCGCCDDDYI